MILLAIFFVKLRNPLELISLSQKLTYWCLTYLATELWAKLITSLFEEYLKPSLFIKAPPGGGPFLSLLISGSCSSSASENSDLKSQDMKSRHIITSSQCVMQYPGGHCIQYCPWCVAQCPGCVAKYPGCITQYPGWVAQCPGHVAQ